MVREPWEVLAPLKSLELFHRLASFRLGRKARAVTATGQAYRITSICWPLHTHYGWGSTNFSQCPGAGRFLRFIGVGGTGPSSGQQTAAGQSWKSLACPLQMAAERMHYNSQTHWQSGAIWRGVCGLVVSATSFTRSWNTLLPTSISIPTSCQHLVLSSFYFLTPLVDVKWVSVFSCAFPGLLIKLISHFRFSFVWNAHFLLHYFFLDHCHPSYIWILILCSYVLPKKKKKF